MSVTPLYFDSAGSSLFGLLHEPVAGQNLREAVLICGPGPQEQKKYHWTQKQIANRLQQAGYTVLRFDYAAYGDSSGKSEDFDLDVCRRNIQDAISYVKASGLVRRVTVVATRIAGPLALKALIEERVKRLVLIDPVLDGAAYLRQMEKMHAEMLDGNPEEAPFRSKTAAHRQLLGFPHTEALALQMRNLRCDTAELKTKSLCLLETRGAPDLSVLEERFAPELDEVTRRSLPVNLKWDQLLALQFQDFPNELIRATVEAVRTGS